MSEIVRTREELAEISGEIGFPLVMKITSPDILHKTDVGGVVAGIRSLLRVFGNALAAHVPARETLDEEFLAQFRRQTVRVTTEKARTVPGSTPAAASQKNGNWPPHVSPSRSS